MIFFFHLILQRLQITIPEEQRREYTMALQRAWDGRFDPLVDLITGLVRRALVS
jgi:hypothetical protein